MANRADGFLASISRIAPADDDDLGESEAPDQMAQILEAIARASGNPQRVVVPMQPAPVFVDAPDLAPLLEAISANRLDPIMMAKTIAAAIVAAMPPQPDLTEVLDGIVTELGRLGKKFNSVAAGGGGGGPSEVGLRAGTNRDPVSTTNPLPVSITTAPLSIVKPNQFDVTTIGVDCPDLADQQSVSIKALAANTEPIYIVESMAAAYTTGYELSPGASVDMDAAAAATVVLKSVTGTMRACTLALA